MVCRGAALEVQHVNMSTRQHVMTSTGLGSSGAGYLGTIFIERIYLGFVDNPASFRCSAEVCSHCDVTIQHVQCCSIASLVIGRCSLTKYRRPRAPQLTASICPFWQAGLEHPEPSRKRCCNRWSKISGSRGRSKFRYRYGHPQPSRAGRPVLAIAAEHRALGTSERLRAIRRRRNLTCMLQRAPTHP